jgi:hypothetical protein
MCQRACKLSLAHFPQQRTLPGLAGAVPGGVSRVLFLAPVVLAIGWCEFHELLSHAVRALVVLVHHDSGPPAL